jgi:uncharacterized protein YegL
MPAFSFKSYYNPYISPTTNSFWGVVSVTANEQSSSAGDTVVSLVCDVSGSMQGAKFNTMIESTEALLMNAPTGIILGVIVFDNNANEVVPLTRITPETDHNGLVQTFRRNIKRLSIFGGTAMSTGIRLALQSQRALRGDFARYCIFLSDGQNTEPEKVLTASVKEAADSHLHLCAYGYGRDWNPEELTQMAEITKGWKPKAVPRPEMLTAEFTGLVARMAKTVASDVVLQLWTPTGAKILSLSQAYPEWAKGDAAPIGDDHTWVVPVPPMSAKDHRDFLVHVELAQVGRRLVAVKPSVVYVVGGQRIEEKSEQNAWIILEQTTDPAQINQVNPVVAGYLGQGQLASSMRAMTEALNRGELKAAERHRTEALDIAQATGNRQMTEVLEDAEQNEVARKTVALGTSTVSLTDEDI